ncbi:unnamed protein product [Sympodiomycopsis kandeliae]
MTRFFISTVFALTALLALDAGLSNAIEIAPNQFENPPQLKARDHDRISSGHYVNSPFGRGCVGTSNLCAVALSRAEDTEKETLHREAPPLLWKVREDEEYQSQLELSGPSLRLKQFYQRLGGKNYDFKRQLSEAELQRLLEQFEEEGELERGKSMNAQEDLRREMKESRLWRNRFRKVTSREQQQQDIPGKMSASSRFGRDEALMASNGPRAGTDAVDSAKAAPRDARLGSRSMKLHKRSLEVRHVDREDSPEQSEDDQFHAAMRARFSRPWSSRARSLRE